MSLAVRFAFDQPNDLVPHQELDQPQSAGKIRVDLVQTFRDPTYHVTKLFVAEVIKG